MGPKTMKKLLSILSSLWFFFWGHLFRSLFYDRQYITGRWFSNDQHGIGALGWKWITKDALVRIFVGINKTARYPICANCKVLSPQNIIFDPDDLNNFHGFGNYYQAIAKIYIGKGSYIGPNVGLITANHDPNNLDNHREPKEIIIGAQCWIGMNSVILPGVELGDKTIVGAGSVVTKSFKDGNCIIAGNPARMIRLLDESGDGE